MQFHRRSKRKCGDAMTTVLPNYLLIQHPLLWWTTLALVWILLFLWYWATFTPLEAAGEPTLYYQTLRSRSPSSSLKGAMTCSQAHQNVQTGLWADPNQGQVYSTETISKFVIALHNQDYDPVRWKIRQDKTYYEKDVQQRFQQILGAYPNKHSAIVLDVGANIGYYTLLSLSLGLNVVSFEPNPANLLRLCESLNLNPGFAARTTLFQTAVSSNDLHGQSMMLHAPRNPGQGFLKPITEEDTDNNIHKAHTTIVSLDHWAQEQGWFAKAVNIPLLKIDVEGKDPLVVLGAKRLLKSGMVQNVLTECRRFGRPVVLEMLETLLEAGFVAKEPRIPVPIMENGTPAKAKYIRDWFLKKLGQNSQVNQDLWWVRKE